MNTKHMGRALAAAAAAAILIAAAGCTDESADTTTTTAETDGSSTSADLPEGVNQADVTFVLGMIPHHEQAIEMSELVIENGDDPEVTALAEQITAAQGPEIEQMKEWLAEWGVDEDTGDSSGMSGSDMPGMEGATGSGMMSNDEMDAMSNTMGADLDEMFLVMMIRHHEGAIEMARTELDDGMDADVQDLARTIIDAQQAEIDTMRSMLESA